MYLFTNYNIFQEQRAHIQFLGSTLTNAESNVVRLEEENRLKEGYAERVKQMTRSLDQLQKASEKREAMEKKLRYIYRILITISPWMSVFRLYICLSFVSSNKNGL